MMSEDFAAGLFIGIVLVAFTAAIIMVPRAIYSSGEKFVLGALKPCSKDMVYTVNIGYEHWVCANQQWIEQ